MLALKLWTDLSLLYLEVFTMVALVIIIVIWPYICSIIFFLLKEFFCFHEIYFIYLRSVCVFETFCSIWYHLYNLNNVKNTWSSASFTKKFEQFKQREKHAWSSASFTKSCQWLLKVTLLYGCFSLFSIS